MNVGEGIALGVFALGIAGYLVNAALDRHSRALARRTDAYLDYLRAQNSMSVLQPGSTEFRNMDSLCLDARSRILIYGPKQVVKALAALKSSPQSYKDPTTLRAFTNLISAMRRDCIRQSVEIEEVARILVLDRHEPIPVLSERKGAALPQSAHYS